MAGKRFGLPLLRAVSAVSLVWASMVATVHAASEVITVRSDKAAFKVVEVAGGLKLPWSLAFLPDGRMLVSERGGTLRVVDRNGRLSDPLAGVPGVYAKGQGGLLDVVLSPSFAADKRIFFSYAEPVGRGAHTAVASAELNLEEGAGGGRLDGVRTLFAQNESPSGNNHWGSRLVFGRDGSLFVTLGDRYSERDRAQALDSHLGKVVRINTDGGVPRDNPFVGKKGALPEIWSYGHRNVQGAALHPESGVLWTHEHGPQGGDEINIGRAGANYGWPVITYGREYVTGGRIGEGTQRDDVQPPVHYWVPSIAPSGMAFYTGDAFPAWQGNLFVGALRGQLVRLVLDGERVVAEERLLESLGSRIRDVRQGPDGRLYLLDESNGRILRLDPV